MRFAIWVAVGVCACGSKQADRAPDGPANAAAVFATGKAPALPAGLRFGATIDDVKKAFPQLSFQNDGRGDPWQAKAGDDTIVAEERGQGLIYLGASIPRDEVAAFTKAWGPSKKDGEETQTWFSPQQHVVASIGPEDGPRAGRSERVALRLELYVPLAELLGRTDGRLSIESDRPLLGASDMPRVRLTTDVGSLVVDPVIGRDGNVGALDVVFRIDDPTQHDDLVARLRHVYGKDLTTRRDDAHAVEVIVGDASLLR